MIEPDEPLAAAPVVSVITPLVPLPASPLAGLSEANVSTST